MIGPLACRGDCQLTVTDVDVGNLSPMTTATVMLRGDDDGATQQATDAINIRKNF